MAPRKSRQKPVEPSSSSDETDGGQVGPPSSLSRRVRKLEIDMIDSPIGTDGSGSTFDLSEYQPGSIIRIRVKDFVTYHAAEFIIGPSLNMVIGPNGTGKSTLVCAICLGLGWGPKNLGRAKEVGEFVKHGCSQATIEIELKGGPDQARGQNVVIERVIKKDGNKSVWALNGVQTSNGEVLKMARSFSIQIDNLCQFLPQDRVVEFAQMQPVEMLASTQRAAAPSDMIKMHEELKALKGQQTTEQTIHNSNKDQLDALLARQQQQRADVERMEERATLKNNIATYEKFKPLIKYKEIRLKSQQAKESLKVARDELGELEGQMEPSLAALRTWKNHAVKTGQLREEQRARLEKAKQNMRRHKQKLEPIEEKLTLLATKRETFKKSRVKIRESRVKYKTIIDRLKQRYQDDKCDFDPTVFQTRMQAARQQKWDCENELQAVDSALTKVQQRALPFQRETESLKRELEGLESRSGQQFRKLTQMSPDTVKAYEWLKTNRSKFKGDVYGPPLLECSVKDVSYAKLVEASLTKSEYLMFTFTDHADLEKFRDVVYGRELMLADIHVRSINRPLAHFRPPVVSGSLKEQYGFDGWMIDLLTGPEPVLAAICDSRRLHRTGYSLDDLSNDQFQRAKEWTDLNCWITPTHQHIVSRRAEYGPQAVSISARAIRNPTIWTDSIDTNAKDEINDRLEKAKDGYVDCQREFRTLKQSKTEITDRLGEAVKELKIITTEKERAQEKYSTWSVLPKQIEQQKERLREFNAQAKEQENEWTEFDQEEDDLRMEKATLAMDFADLAIEAEGPHIDLIEAEIWHIEAKSQEDTLKSLTQDVTTLINEKKEQVQDLEVRVREIRTIGKQLAEEAKAITDNLTEDELATHQRLNNDGVSLDALEADIMSMSTRLGLLHEGNPAAVAQYEKRKGEITQLENRLVISSDSLVRLQARMGQIRDIWEPRLDTLVDQISEAFSQNFARIGCAGEVSLYKPSDEYGKWEIQIHVKFRETEQLSQLNSHRQSGGERSVSTIFYLMALQSLARSPFRVVDEINQGMDPRNERMVHERMVEIACGRDGSDQSDDADHSNDDTLDRATTSQYFLITPKLLTGLKYHRRMKVHVINSGEEIPQEIKPMDLSLLVGNVLATKSAA